MRFSSLEAFGVHPDLIAVWEAALGQDLLAIQEKAVRAGVLDGKSILAVAPASAGKTLIAEMAIGRTVMGRGRAWYLSPTRALTEQKHADLAARFGPLGVRAVLTTGEHTSSDRAIEQGDFDLAVTVPEKARAMMARNPALAAGAGLVVVDELELLADAERGPALEMLLGDVMGLGARVQIVGLSATAANSAEVAGWLGAEVVEDRKRPVELRLGVVLGGVFGYREHNTGQHAEEPLEYEPLGGENGSHLAGLALAMARAGEQTIVFVRDKASANALAAAIAEESGLPEATGLRARLEECEPTAAVGFLRRMAESGVSFHHGDLRAEERLAVEAAVASGEVRLLVATSTLAAGVNLPARNVLIDPAQWQGATAEGARPALRPLPLADFLAMAGRAGRLGYGEPFGRAMMIAATPMQRDALMTGYVDADPPRIVPALAGLSAQDRAVALGISALAWQGGLEAAWKASLSARIGGLKDDEAWRKGAEAMLAAGLVDGERRPTPALRAAAGGSMDAATLLHMKRFADASPREADWLDLLAAATAAPYMGRMPMPMGRGELRERDYVTELLAWGEERGVGGEVMREMLRDPAVPLMDRQRAAKLALVLLQWASGRTVVEVEEAVRLTAGRMESLAGAAGWLMDVGTGMAAAKGWPKVAVQRLSDAARAVKLGLPVAERAHIRDDEYEGQEGAGMAKVRRAKPVREAKEAKVEPPALVLDERMPDRVVAGGKIVKLTRAEFLLLWRLAEETGACVRYYQLVAAMFGAEQYEGPHQVYSHASRVRRKLVAALGEEAEPWVATVPKEGVKLDLAANLVTRVERAEKAA